MKRDMVLIRSILSDLEENCSGVRAYKPDPAKFSTDSDSFSFHCRLILERGLASGNNSFDGIYFFGLTWDGFDFLDDSRNSEVWNATLKSAGNLSFGVFKDVLKSVAKAFALKSLGLG